MKRSIPILKASSQAIKSSILLLFAAFSMATYAQAPPVGENIQSFCSQSTWQNAGFVGMPGDNLGDLMVYGDNLTWYSDSALTQVINNPDSVILVDGDVYYVTQTIGGVESPALTVNVIEQDCACIKEPDFEDQQGNFDGDGYEFYSQHGDLHKVCGMQLGPTAISIPLGTPNATQNPNLAVPVTQGVDQELSGSGVNLPRTSPFNPNSKHAVRVGNHDTGVSDIITMTKEFIAGEVVVFNYAIVLETGGHPYEIQPFFEARLYDQNDNLIQRRCIVSSDDDCIFLTDAGSNYYTTWSCLKFNTRDLQGQKARIEITTADCEDTIHLGFAYIDDFYVGPDAGSGCNDYNFGYLAIDTVSPVTGTGANTCFVVEPPAVAGACSSQAAASLPFPMQVCGVFEQPTSSGQINYNFSIDILQNGVVVGTVSNPVFAGNTFCFTIDETDINVAPYGDFQFSSVFDFELNCGTPYHIVVDDQTDFEACPPAGCPLPLYFCDDGSGMAEFDLSLRNSVLTNGWQHGVNFSYYETADDAFDQVNEITDYKHYKTSTSRTIYVRTEWTLPGGGSNCFYLVELELEVLAVPEIDLGDDDIIYCGGTVNVPLYATPSNLADLQTITYEWQKDGVVLPVLGSTYTATETGTYTVTVANNLECPVTDTIVIEQVDYSVDLGGDLDMCGEVGETTLTATITDNGSTFPLDMSQVTYNWSTGETTPSITINTSGTYTVETTYKGCVETDQIDVVLAVKPEISLGEDFSKCIDEKVTLTANISNDGGTPFEYIWYRDGGVISGEVGSSIEITEAGTYRVEAAESGASTCFGEDSIEVSLYDNENCVITQGISPNGDQYNQSFDLAFLNDRTGIAKVEIFNRHGRLVYEKSGGYSNEWIGQTTDGDELGTGTYFYVIKLNAVDAVFNTDVLTGWIYVNRQVN